MRDCGVKPRLHDTTCRQTGCQTGLTTGCIVYTNIQFDNRFDNRPYRVNGVCQDPCSNLTMGIVFSTTATAVYME